MQQLAIVKQLREQTMPDPASSAAGAVEGLPAIKAYTESRPYAASVAGPHSLSASTLRGPGKFAVPPIVFTNRAETEGVFVMHLGAGL